MTHTAPQTQDAQTDQLAGFRQALEARDMRAIRHLLSKRITSLPPDLGGEALLAAVRALDRATVVPLLRCGADPNYRDGIGQTPVYAAVEANQPDMLKDLLAAGASPDGAPVAGAAPILHAVDRGYIGILEILTKSGAAMTPTYPDSIGDSLLHRAVERQYIEIVQHLIAAGMPIDIENDWGDRPLHTAVGYRSPMITPLLQLGADVHARAGNGSTPALRAAFIGSPEDFELLVAAGADPLAHENHGQNAFDIALTGRKPAMAAWVLQRYPSLAPSGEKLDAAFVSAVRKGCLPVVQVLAHLGADFGQKVDGRTLFQIAPPKAQELKRFLRALKSGAEIASAMGDDAPCAPAASHATPTL